MPTNPVLSVIKLPDEALKSRTFKHFSTFPSTFFVVVGKVSGKWEDVATDVCEELNIPFRSSTIRRFYETEDVENIVSHAAIPDCIGIVAFGMSPKRAQNLHEWLVKAKIDGDYAIFDNQSKLIKRASLVGHLRKFLQFVFSEDA